MAGKRESQEKQASEGQETPPIPEFRREFAKLFNARKEELGLTRAEIARRSGVSVSTIQEIENPTKPRKFSHEILEALSEALDWQKGRLPRDFYRISSGEPDPIVQDLKDEFTPYFEKLDAIPGIQKDLAAIARHLGVDVIYEHPTSKIETAPDEQR